MTDMQSNELENYKLLDYRLADIEQKLDIILEQLDLTLKANARLRVDLAKTLPEVVEAALKKRAIQGYSRITA
jgi:hypothetical protein